MKVLGVDFDISEEHIDSEQVLVIPGDGVIMPIMIDKVPNLFNFLAKHKNVINKKPVKLFLHILNGRNERRSIMRQIHRWRSLCDTASW